MEKIKIILTSVLLLVYAFTKENENTGQDGHTMHKSGKDNVYVTQTYSARELKTGDKTVCPVMGVKFTVNGTTKSISVKGKKYYVCCPCCMGKIKKDPNRYLADKYVKQTYKSRELKAGDRAICPVMGSKFIIKKNTKYLKVKNIKIFVCCPACTQEIRDNPDKYLKK